MVDNYPMLVFTYHRLDELIPEVQHSNKEHAPVEQHCTLLCTLLVLKVTYTCRPDGPGVDIFEFFFQFYNVL